MAHSKLKINQSKLRQPLYSAPPGSPECDPGVDLVQIKRDRRQYLPPYRYDKDEQPRNIYRTSDEAYSTLAKSLAYEYECCKHAYTEHQVILQNLTITQRKFFADAHMERAANLPVRPKKGEPPINSIIRLVDIIYGKVFLEYFASKDGNLLQSQIENLNKATEDFGMAEEHDEVRVAQNTLRISVSANQTDGLIGNHVSETPLATNTSAESRFEPKYNDEERQTKDDDGERQNTNSIQQSSYEEHGESSFDKLYYDISTKEESAIKSKDSGEVSASSESVTAQVSHSKLRQELLREILQITDLLRRETDKVQKKVLSQHLTNLRAKFNKYRGKEVSDDNSRSSDEEETLETRTETKKIQALNSQRAVRTSGIIDYGNSSSGGEEKAKNRNTTERIQVLHSQQRVRTNDTIAGYRNMPREEVATKERKMVFEFEHGSSRSIPVELTRRIPDLETGLRFIKIVAPVSLQEGYTFEAKYREWKFLAKVPKGGVQKGDLFVTPMLNPSGASKQVVVYECTLDSMEIPRGRWRDGFCSCFRDPLCLLSFFCPQGKLQKSTDGEQVKYLIFLQQISQPLFSRTLFLSMASKWLFLKFAPECNSTKLVKYSLHMGQSFFSFSPCQFYPSMHGP